MLRKLSLFFLVSLVQALSGCASVAPIALPGGVDLAAVDAQGAYQTEVIIATPAYRGVEPRLKLAYNSRQGNGMIGAGWRLDGLSSIQRASIGRGAPSYTSRDIFLLDGRELVACTPNMSSPSCRYPAGTVFQAYTSYVETYRRIAFSQTTQQWFVWSKNGEKRTYSPRPTRAGADPYHWDLSSIEDTMGNHVLIQMTRDSPPSGLGESYPDTITYGPYQIKFHYETRPDPTSYGIGHTLVTAARRLRSIDITAGGQRSAFYTVAYDTGASTGRSVLREVRRYGTDAQVDSTGALLNSGQVLTQPPLIQLDTSAPGEAPWTVRELTNTNWGLPIDGGRLPPIVNGVALPITSPFGRFKDSNVGDFDGNGQSDWVQAAPEIVFDGQSDWVQAAPEIVFDPSARVNRLLFTTVLAGKPPPVYVQQTLMWPFGGLVMGTHAADVDGDGRSDLVFVTLGARIPGVPQDPSPYFLHLTVAHSKGDGTYEWAQGAAQVTTWETREASLNRRSYCRAGDVDGDGRDDIVCSFTREDGSHFLGTARSLGDGTFAVTEQAMPFAVQGETRMMALGDVNADGLADVMFLDFPHCLPGQPNNCTVQYELVTALSAGHGTYEIERVPTTWDRGNPLFFAADINGDGRTDYVVSLSKPEGVDGELVTALRRPLGGFDFTSQPIPVALRIVEHTFAVGDANGDTRTDFLVISRQAPGRGGCSTSLSSTHINLHRVFSRGDGTFDWPARWEDCSRSRELPVAWDDVRFGPVEPQAADLNGDGSADFLVAATTPQGSTTWLYEDLSSHPVGDVVNWMPGELNGDGRKDWIYVRATPTGPLLSTLLSTVSGYRVAAFSPIPNTQRLTVARNWRVMDVDGNGLDDLVYLAYFTQGDGVQVHIWFAQGNGNWRHQIQHVLTAAPQSFRNTKLWRAMDANGDGRVDLVYMSAEAGSLSVFCLLSNGDGTWTEQQQPQLLAWTGAPTNWLAADVNSDGRSDLVHVSNLNPGARVVVLIAGGDGTYAVTPPTDHWTDPSGEPLFNAAQWLAMDGNGDGLTDLVHVAPSTRISGVAATLTVHTLLSRGNGSWTSQTSSPATAWTGEMRSWKTMSANGDERRDLVHVWVNGSSIALQALTYSTPAGWRLSPAATTNLIATAQPSSSPKYAFQIADVDGNGTHDLTRFDLLATGMRVVSVMPHLSADLPTKVTNEWGGSIQVSYAPGALSLDNDLSAGCRLPAGAALQAVSTLTVSDGRRSSTTQFQYACAKWSQAHRGFLGWEERYATVVGEPGRPSSTTREHQHMSDSCFTRPTYSVVYDSNARVYRKTIISYVDPGNAPPFRCLVNYRNDTAMNGGNIGLNVMTYLRYDEFGNLTNVFEYGADAERNDDERSTTVVYRPNLEAYIVGLPHQVILGDGIPARNVLRSTFYCYDGDNGSDATSCDGSITRGQLTAVLSMNKNGWFDRTILTYDTAGNLSSVRDPQLHTQQITYETIYQLFPESNCNSLGQCRTQVWDPIQGRPTESADENNQRTIIHYDALGRAKGMDLPDGATVTMNYIDLGNPQVQRIRTTVTERGATLASGMWTQRMIDGLGRTYAVTRRGAGGTEYALDIEFLSATTLPRRESRWYIRGETPSFDRFEYDPIGRLVRCDHPDGTAVTLNYTNNATEQMVERTDERGNTRITLVDAYGRIKGVRVKHKGRDVETNYTYDGADRITSLRDAEGNVTNLDWDVRGNNFATTDPDRGVWTFDSDRMGRLTRSIDARQKWTRFSYDPIGRLSTKQYGSYREVHLHYDEASAGASKGRLTTVVDWSEYKCPIKSGMGYASEERTYDARGRVASTKRCIEGTLVQMRFTYDSLDRLKTITYPDSEVVTYDYDEAGRLRAMSGIVDNFEYNAAGQLVAADFTNGTRQTYDYHPKRSWLTGTSVTFGTSKLLQLGYEYYPNGLVRNTTSTINPLNLTYAYDAMDRLTSVSGAINQQIDYDAISNIAYNSLVGTYSYQAVSPSAGCGQLNVIACPRAVKVAGGKSLRYDDNGNLIAIDETVGGMLSWRSFDWNIDGEVASITDLSGTATRLRHDADGRRVMRQRGNDVILYFDPYVEISYTAGASGTQQLTQYYYAGGVLVALKGASGRVWLHKDNIGSVRAMTDASGAVVARNDFQPFGSVHAVSGTALTSRLFTDHDIDTQNSLIDMGARIYEPNLGRFISPDPTVPDLHSAQSLNAYGYAYNNPVSMLEPRGTAPEDAGSSMNLSPAGDSDAGTSPFESWGHIARFDDLGIKYTFVDNPQGWRDFHLAEAAIREGMRQSPMFSDAIWEMTRGVGKNNKEKARLNIDLRRLDLILGPDPAHGKTMDLQGSGRRFSFLIGMRPSENVSTTYVLRSFLRSNGDLDLPDGGILQFQVTMPGTFQTTLWHEVGHAYGAYSTNLPVQTNVDIRHPINAQAIRFMREAYSVFGVPLTEQQDFILRTSIHPFP